MEHFTSANVCAWSDFMPEHLLLYRVYTTSKLVLILERKSRSGTVTRVNLQQNNRLLALL